MRAVVQRVHQAAVIVEGRQAAAIDMGLLVYLGVGVEDTEADAEYVAQKLRYLRIFPDDDKPMNRDVVDASGRVLVVSAFTTQADARKGRRPALTNAADPDRARELYDLCCKRLRAAGVETHTGCFKEHMEVTSTNDGPICILLDSKRAF